MALHMRTLLGSVIALAALASGCFTHSSANGRARSELARQRAMFDQAGLTSYVITEQQSCFCDPNFTAAMRVTVTNGNLVSAVYVADGKPVPANLREGVKTIAEVFDLIEEQLEDGETTVNVTYDPVRHYPTVMNSYRANLPDSGLNIALSNLEVTPVPATLSAEACRRIEAEARAAVLPAIEDHVACKVVSDCYQVMFDASCFESCYALVGTGGLAAVEAAVNAVEATQCKAYHDGGCTLILPPCAPPPPALYCTRGVCSHLSE